METANKILTRVHHRHEPLPTTPWKYYQEWNDALFLHLPITYDELRPLVPRKLELDYCGDKYYISIVAFKMQNIRPKFLPSIELISNFYEINVRTYVKHREKTGVYFLSIEAEKFLSAFIAKKLSGLPYEKSSIIRDANSYFNQNEKRGFYFKADFKPGSAIKIKSDLDKWLTERYRLFIHQNDKLYRYDIHHKEWKLKQLDYIDLDINYKLNSVNITPQSIQYMHYSKGVKVVAWNPIEIE